MLRRVARGSRLVVGTRSHGLIVCDLDAPGVVGRPSVGAEARVLDVASGRVLTSELADGTPTAIVRELATGDVRALPGSAPTHAVFAPGGAARLRPRGPVLHLVDVASGSARAWHDGHEAEVAHLALARRLDARDPRAERRGARARPGRAGGRVGAGERAGQGAVVFGRDRRLLYAMGPQALVAWEIATGLEVTRHPEAGQRVLSMALSPDGQVLAALGPGMVPRVVDLAGGSARVARFERVEDAVHVAFTEGGAVRCLRSAWLRGAT